MPRIQVYTDAETKRRIELAAARRDVAVTQYCLEAIRQRLADEEMLEKEKIEIPVRPEEKDENLIADLRALRERILAERGGKLIDVDQIIETMREERDGELTRLR